MVGGDIDPVDREVIRQQAQAEVLGALEKQEESTFERDRALRALVMAITAVLPVLGAVIGLTVGLVGGVTVIVYRLLTTGNIGW